MSLNTFFRERGDMMHFELESATKDVFTLIEKKNNHPSNIFPLNFKILITDAKQVYYFHKSLTIVFVASFTLYEIFSPQLMVRSPFTGERSWSWLFGRWVDTYGWSRWQRIRLLRRLFYPFFSICFVLVSTQIVCDKCRLCSIDNRFTSGDIYWLDWRHVGRSLAQLNTDKCMASECWNNIIIGLNFPMLVICGGFAFVVLCFLLRYHVVVIQIEKLQQSMFVSGLKL